jgi:hypothetical protein
MHACKTMQKGHALLRERMGDPAGPCGLGGYLCVRDVREGTLKGGFGSVRMPQLMERPDGVVSRHHNTRPRRAVQCLKELL